MSKGGGFQRLPVIVTIIFSLMLMVVPLPDWATPYRPDWVALTLIYWAMMMPRTWSVGSAWIIGMVLDVAQGTILGQHALALCFIVFVTVRFHLLMRVFPMQQLAATIFAILALYQFLLFWINGVAGVNVPAVGYWGPVLTGTLIWPFVLIVLRGVRLRVHLGQ
jgi:rod shape-determining protein MreD